MAKLNLKDALNTSLARTKLYIDTELAKKADSSHGTHVSYGGNGSATTVSRSDHTHSYLPLTGGTVSGAITSTVGGGQGGFIISNSTAKTMLYASSNVGEHIFGGNNDGTNQVKDFVRVGANKLKYETGGNVYDIYHAGNKPSLSALGAAASSHGTHVSYGGNGSATTVSRSDHTHSYLPLSGGTMTGNITFTDVTSTTYPAKSKTISWNGSTDGADIYYQVDASDKGRLVLNTRDDADCVIAFANKGTIISTIDNSGNFSGKAATATKATQDSAGQQINTTYIKGLSVSGKTITYTKGDGTTGTITTQDTNTTYSAATTSAAGLMSAADKTKLDGIATSANNYSHPNSGATAGSYGPSANASPAHSGTFSVPYITINAAGHVTSASTKTITLPADNNTWRGIQNNLTSDSTSDSLSAAQGKALKALIDGKAASSHGTHVSYGGNGSATTVSRSDHTHNYAGSSSAGGAATSANKVNTNLVIKLNSGSTEGTNLFTFNGSAAKTINITPSAIGAAASSHGTHLTIGTGSGNAAAGNHTHSYLPLTGGTVTGTLNISPDSIANATFASTYTTLRKPVTMSSDCTVSGSLIASGGTTTSLLSLTATNAYTEFQYGHGVVRVAEKNHLYLQAGSLVGETAAEVRCTLYKKASEYTNLRAYNLCAQGAVYAQGTNISSDRTLKENIKYISNANTINDEDITIMDCYNFIKDDLGLATYNYIDDSEKQQKIGFIAQDVLYDPIKQTDNKIGQLVITKLLGSEQLDPENPKLTYDVNNILGVMLGAMQVTANKTAALEQENKELKELVNNLITRIEKLEQK